MRIEGKWRIVEMDLWDQEAVELLGPAFIELEGQGGRFRFIAVDGSMSCKHGEKNGRPHVAFTWEGNDECDPVSGRGWVSLRTDGSLGGHVYFDQGDDSAFRALLFRQQVSRRRIDGVSRRRRPR
jgi:hypothetical protein